MAAAKLLEALDWVLDVTAQLDVTRRMPLLHEPPLGLPRGRGCRLRARVMPMFREHVRERVGVPAEPMDLALRAIVCHRVDSSNDTDYLKLLVEQFLDGGWVGWTYWYGRLSINLGNRARVTTALAMKAMALGSLNSSYPA